MRTSAVWVLFSSLFVTCSAGPPVKVSLRSSWRAPPVLVEIIETVALENPEAFFPFVDSLTNPETHALAKDLSPEAVHQLALQAAVAGGFLSEPGALTAVEMNLAMHSATPKIEAFYQHYSDLDSKVDCGSWVDWYGTVVCDVETLVQLAGRESIDSQEGIPTPFSRPKILSFDHVTPSPSLTLDTPLRTAILYASLDSGNFRELHSYLLSHASSNSIEYVLRYIPPKQADDAPRSFLSGYGVALDLKKMDYLAVDDRNMNGGAGASDDISEEIGKHIDVVASLIEAYPENTTAPEATVPLTEAEIFELSWKASQIVAESSEPLDTLRIISQDFPKYATSLGRRVRANESVVEELHNNQLRVQAGGHAFWFNGAPMAEKDITPYGLLRMFRKERGIMSSLTSLGLSRAQAMELLTHPIIAAGQGDKAGFDGFVDASDRPEGDEVITWWNDLEKDSRYQRWEPAISALLRPLYPGQFHNIKLNIFNIVLVLDLSQTNALSFIGGAVANIVERSFPFRFGIVPSIESEDGLKMARLFYFLVDNFGRKKTMGYLKKMSLVGMPPQHRSPNVQWDLVRSEFEDLLDVEESELEDAIFDSILEGQVEVSKSFDKIDAYAKRVGASMSSNPEGHCFVNGKHAEMSETFLRSMQMEVTRQIQHLQEQLYEGKLTDDNSSSMSTYFYDLPTTQKTRNRFIIPSNAIGSLRIYNLPELLARTGFDVGPGAFVYPPEGETPITLFLIADFNTEEGLELLKSALASINEQSETRLSFIHNPSDPKLDITAQRAPVAWLLMHLISKGLLSKSSPAQLIRALGLDAPLATDGGRSQRPLSQEGTFQALAGQSEVDSETMAQLMKSSRLLIRDMQLPAGSQGILVNGRIIAPLETKEFGSADFRALETYELRRRVEPVVSAIYNVLPSAASLDRASLANLVSLASSVISSISLPDPSEAGLFDTALRPRQRSYRILESNYTGFEYGDNTTALYQISAIIDPVGEIAQRWSSILQWISTFPDTYIEIHLNPGPHSEIPLKRFFRYNLVPSLSFDQDGHELPAQTIFEDLPVEPIYTLAMDVPSSWLVRPREALYDLDNIQLGNISPEDSSVDAVFDLDYIVVEGHARETVTGAPPRGVQLELRSGDNAAVDDTLITANLGYFQFKTKPGVFKLEIREGRGRDIFTIDSVGNEGWNSPSVDAVGNEITVTSFEGLTLYPRFNRVPGMETVDVLDPRYRKADDSEGMLGGITSLFKSIFGSTDSSVAVANKQADINIFTVASGLLYERFASIMILSVMRNTKSTVKFWFIENFLSPSFLEFIPHLAKAYGFQYELVTYKWPSWLRAQKEKQRIIWAYKILFLDVLFPMDLKKVLFVDADQIVRADLQELVDLDLHGAPYGYTPMGDDNTDMEGFRFWKTGYWKDFLKGRPYHISALYVVDLVRFRQFAAGDILRGQYQQLSADPNSLSNLDQDLPNNLQREVPIFSLHEDWLWCETWCSKDRLHRAKTIDLCQNPLTKEPKLARARQIPEWEVYDTEISQFTRKLAEKGLIKSRIAAADTNVLAGAGNAPSSTLEVTAEPTDTSGADPVDGFREEL
ncbi:UDP-glucose:glycoprotein glucosyltransferase-domain-containing protein [Armillaria novae-zelandiae]|uniref:UDP-glucose:glycoprotein glucosyltransferase-domain-containing protein n=1 Tax=Armillaria novae-zelandiae TaxID=153914 RepID=A0AA39UFS4_9AGAR|nr:UDP-glucose:glycoprotein glucosyltransferase-domain-containing protein [Armillaria novae-zelandiae]